MNCQYCKSEMENVAKAEEGQTEDTFWCPECGVLKTDFEGITTWHLPNRLKVD